MANLIRWEPFRESRQMHDALDRFIDQAMWPDSRFGGGRMGRLALDVSTTDEEFIIRADIPGLKPEDLDISVSGDTLTIQAESHAETVDEETTYLLRERRFSSFSRSITLPERVEADKAEAKFADGVLTLTLPKSEEVKPKRINVSPN